MQPSAWHAAPACTPGGPPPLELVPYSVRLGAADVAAELVVLYTVPADYVAVVRDIEAWNFGGETDKLFTTANIPGPLAVAVWVTPEVATDEWTQWQGRLVMNAGDVLQAQGIASSWTVVASGYLLSAP